MSSSELGKGRRDVAEHVIGLWFGKTEISEVVEGHGKPSSETSQGWGN